MNQPGNRLDAALRACLDEAISRYCGTPSRIGQCSEIGGGSISRSLVAQSESARWFVKVNSADRAELFAAEADGLAALRACPALRVPAVVGHGISGRQAYLILEHLELQPLRDDAAVNAGRALADLHRISGAGFGWPRDNFIGSTPQRNAAQPTWPLFFARQRLLPQLELARRQGHQGRLIADGERLVYAMPALFGDRSPPVSLVHGDLWHGNAASVGRQLALFDPAVYYGDRETDLAMSELFGGFPPRFYAAYREAWPLSEGFEQRKTLYNLYHVLNHLNLFGGGYRQQAERMTQSLLAEIG
jgi:fructosamine-3-kinase